MTLEYISQADLAEFEKRFKNAAMFLRTASLCGEYVHLKRKSRLKRWHLFTDRDAARLQELQALVDAGALQPQVATRFVELDFRDPEMIHYTIYDTRNKTGTAHTYKLEKREFAGATDLVAAACRWASTVMVDATQGEEVEWQQTADQVYRSQPVEMLR